MLLRLDRKIRVFLQWTLEMCFARDTVQLLNVHSIRSGRLEELLDSASAAGALAGTTAVGISDQTATVR